MPAGGLDGAVYTAVDNGPSEAQCLLDEVESVDEAVWLAVGCGLPISGTIKQDPEAHIPLDDWLTWTSWNAP